MEVIKPRRPLTRREVIAAMAGLSFVTGDYQLFWGFVTELEANLSGCIGGPIALEGLN